MLSFWWILKRKGNMLFNKLFFTAFILGFQIAFVQNRYIAFQSGFKKHLVGLLLLHCVS